MTFKQRLENYWYHYKWHTVIALFLVVTISVCTVQCANREKYDQNAALYCNRVITDNAVAALEEQFVLRVPDRDGNGAVAFEVYNVSYNADSAAGADRQMANSQKLMAMVPAGDFVLYMVDDYGYDRLMNGDTMELFEAYDFMPDKNGTAWNWKGSKLQQAVSHVDLPENLYFCVRKVADTMADSPEVQERADQAIELIQLLMAEG